MLIFLSEVWDKTGFAKAAAAATPPAIAEQNDLRVISPVFITRFLDFSYKVGLSGPVRLEQHIGNHARDQ
jgi:hypothetical protein